jgi:hypothetical protein
MGHGKDSACPGRAPALPFLSSDLADPRPTSPTPPNCARAALQYSSREGRQRPPLPISRPGRRALTRFVYIAVIRCRPFVETTRFLPPAARTFIRATRAVTPSPGFGAPYTLSFRLVRQYRHSIGSALSRIILYRFVLALPVSAPPSLSAFPLLFSAFSFLLPLLSPRVPSQESGS